MRIHMIGKEEIQNLNLSRIINEFVNLLEDYKKNKELYLLSFGIGCYEDDERALFDIPEVRAWAKALIKEIPYILSVIDKSTLKWFVPCVAEIEILSRNHINTAWRIHPEAVKAFMRQTFEAQHNLFNYLSSTTEEFSRLSDDHFARFTSIFHG